MYVAFKVVLSGLKEPVPLLLHIPVVAPIVTEPFKITLGLVAHTVWSTPASTTGRGVIKTVKLSVTAVQLPFAVDVKTITTFPFEISKGLGLYVVFNVISSGLNVPVPLLDH